MYYIDDTISSKDLISINNTQTNWGLLDYIHYYASLGNETYIRLEKICDEYEGIPLRVILLAIGEKYIKEYVIKDGSLDFSYEEFNNGKAALDFVKYVKNRIKVRITSPVTFFFLLLKTYFLQDIDREKLSNSVISRYGTENYGSALQCAMAIEHWYNFRSKTYRYISNEIMPRR